MNKVESAHSLKRSWVVSVCVAVAGAALLAGGGTVALAAPSRAAHAAVTIPTPKKDPMVAALVPASLKKQGS